MKQVVGDIRKNGIKYSKNIYCGYLLESPPRGDSYKYTQHVFLGVNNQKPSVLLSLKLLFPDIRL